ncbi:hypothetical protein EV200_1084 [Pedobacter psychrotolerans]|uniref:Uncharacterized protein n=1 Tax=Pedobacter psychrotolerans TaxID=1843235 RepID=A0A4R2H4L2_9SPHI|nr:hypothetical protein EV200_1084 [Pedobacter psychrotolerans]
MAYVNSKINISKPDVVNINSQDEYSFTYKDTASD